ncbi:MAG: DUF4153 domain-containing protein [Sneathiella sp.]|nr:DUF4153 domain-containing protein [Sneathiella sp.]
MKNNSLNDQSFPSKTLLLIALVQGLALLLLHQSIELKFWPYENPQWLFSFYSIATVTPIMLLLGLSNGSERSVYRWTLCFSVAVFFVGYYIGSQAIPIAHVNYSGLLVAFILTLLVATFKGLMYVQHLATGEPLSYSMLFRLSWRNFLTLALSLLFALCCWGVLMLWAGLFKAIDIDFFYDLFTEPWFYYPTLALANGFGVIIFRQQSDVIDTITRIQQALMKFLLVFLVFVSILFLVTLPFTGLSPLWESGGSMLILCMQAIMLFFINAVYQDDPESNPYPIMLHRFIYLGVALLPIYSVISAYGLSLRVDQYGWSLSRCWAFLLWALFALFSFGYLWGIVKLKDHWLRQLSWVNVRMGFLVLVLMFVVNSPLLDFRKISVSSQLSRLDSGKISLSDLDYQYFRRDLVKPGYLALENLKKNVSETHPEIVVRINSLYAKVEFDGIGSSEELFLSAINTMGLEIPSGLGSSIYGLMSNSPWRISQNIGYYLFSVDLNSDSKLEYVLAEESNNLNQLTMFYMKNGEWESRSLNMISVDRDLSEVVINAVKNKEYLTREAKWNDIEIGGVLFRVK